MAETPQLSIPTEILLSVLERATQTSLENIDKLIMLEGSFSAREAGEFFASDEFAVMKVRLSKMGIHFYAPAFLNNGDHRDAVFGSDNMLKLSKDSMGVISFNIEYQPLRVKTAKYG